MNLPSAKSMVGAARTGWGVYSGVKSVANAVTSPVQWVRGKVIDALRAVLLAAFKATLGPRLAELAVERMNLVGKTVDLRFDVTVPEALVEHLNGPDALGLLRGVVNETLAAPLELLGWRAGSVALEFEESTRKLDVLLQVGVLPLEHEAALPAPASADTPVLESATSAALPPVSPTSPAVSADSPAVPTALPAPCATVETAPFATDCGPGPDCSSRACSAES